MEVFKVVVATILLDVQTTACVVVAVPLFTIYVTVPVCASSPPPDGVVVLEPPQLLQPPPSGLVVTVYSQTPALAEQLVTSCQAPVVPVPAQATAPLGKVPVQALVATPAEHETVLPPVEPAQVHDQGPEPETALLVPELQRFTVGVEVGVLPLAEPQEPDSGAEQEAVLPPSLPLQVQIQEPVPDTDTVEALPEEHRFFVGAEVLGTLAAEPHAPLVGGGV